MPPLSELILDPPQPTRRRTRLSKSAFYRDIQKGLFTPPVRVGARTTAWPRHEVDALIAARIAGATPEQLRALVRQLVAQRAALMPSMGTGVTK
jgi:prophage regulatory protein